MRQLKHKRMNIIDQTVMKGTNTYLFHSYLGVQKEGQPLPYQFAPFLTAGD